MKNNPNTTEIKTNSDVLRKITRVINLDDTEILITETKLKNILNEHKECMISGSDWKTPFGLIVTIFTVFSTTEFTKKLFGINNNTWEALFIFILIFSIIWFAFSICLKIKNRKRNNIDYLLQKIKNKT